MLWLRMSLLVVEGLDEWSESEGSVKVGSVSGDEEENYSEDECTGSEAEEDIEKAVISKTFAVIETKRNSLAGESETGTFPLSVL
jgi:hypothetical protein